MLEADKKVDNRQISLKVPNVEFNFDVRFWTQVD